MRRPPGYIKRAPRIDYGRPAILVDSAGMEQQPLDLVGGEDLVGVEELEQATVALGDVREDREQVGGETSLRHSVVTPR